MLLLATAFGGFFVLLGTVVILGIGWVVLQLLWNWVNGRGI